MSEIRVCPSVADAGPVLFGSGRVAEAGLFMDVREAPAGVDGLVLLAVSQAVADSLPRKRRRQLVSRLLAIAADWERESNVVALTPLTAGGEAALRAAAARLRCTARTLAWSPIGED